MTTLGRAGISLDDVTDKLVEDGVRLFADAADKLLAAVAKKRADILEQQVDEQKLALGHALETRSANSPRNGATTAISASCGSAISRCGPMPTRIAGSAGWTASTTPTIWRTIPPSRRRSGARRFKDAVLLGMGGSSLGPEVLARTFGQQSGWPRLRILDSTVPAQIAGARSRRSISPRRCSSFPSKSGSTTEPNVLDDYFFERVANAVGGDKAGDAFHRHHRSRLGAGEARPKQQKFRHVFYGVPSIGGRYSVLSPFGLVPAAIAGIDVAALMKARRG